MSPSEANLERPDSGRCTATKRNGERCRALGDPFCVSHRDPEHMRSIGRRGGSRSPFTKLREVADDDLREEARTVMQRAMRGEDVPKAALDAARSLFSYGSTKPPEAEQPAQVASEDALLARLSAPETWTPRLREAINRASVTDPEIKRKIDAFTREMRLAHGRTVAGLEEVGLVRVIPASQAEQLRDDALEAKARAGGGAE